jgi:hypothetical protein
MHHQRPPIISQVSIRDIWLQSITSALPQSSTRHDCLYSRRNQTPPRREMNTCTTNLSQLWRTIFQQLAIINRSRRLIQLQLSHNVPSTLLPLLDFLTRSDLRSYPSLTVMKGSN